MLLIPNKLALTAACFGLAFFGALSLGAQEKEMSDQARLRAVGKSLDSMRGTLNAAVSRLDSARKGKDIIKLNCVNEKLTAINGLVKISEEAEVALKEAIAKRDAEGKQHEFTKVLLADKRVAQLRLEVEGCVGEMSKFTGNTDIVVVTDENVRGDDADVAPYQPAFEALNSDRPPAVTGSE